MLSDNLKTLLASTQSFAIKSQNFHWNAEGSNFPQYHEFFNTLYEDVNATIDVFLSQIKRYPQMGDTLDSILAIIGEDKVVDYARRFIFDEKGVEVFNFGKHKGRPVVDVLKSEPQYYDWMMRGDFPLHTKQKLTEILNRTLLKNI